MLSGNHMKKAVLISTFLIFALLFTGCSNQQADVQEKEPVVEQQTDEDSTSGEEGVSVDDSDETPEESVSVDDSDETPEESVLIDDSDEIPEESVEFEE